ncbi:Hypothetical protein POVN_LOCUS669 [uncultured virus]|nr:Hypothetical protein POVN_LOCUS669 [uncultured virus]
MVAAAAPPPPSLQMGASAQDMYDEYGKKLGKEAAYEAQRDEAAREADRARAMEADRLRALECENERMYELARRRVLEDTMREVIAQRDYEVAHEAELTREGVYPQNQSVYSAY